MRVSEGLRALYLYQSKDPAEMCMKITLNLDLHLFKGPQKFMAKMGSVDRPPRPLQRVICCTVFSTQLDDEKLILVVRWDNKT
eukprot:4111704-Pleurochrysis_carterae.AAC.1